MNTIVTSESDSDEIFYLVFLTRREKKEAHIISLLICINVVYYLFITLLFNNKQY